MSFASSVLPSLRTSIYDTAVPAHEPRVPYFFSLGSPASLATVLKRPYALFLENGNFPLLELSLRRFLAESPDFALSLTTPSAYHCSLARTLTNHFHERFGIAYDKIIPIETCLQEAISNALIHGNLDVFCPLKTMEDFDIHYTLLNERLKTEPYKSRRVLVAAWHEEKCFKLAVGDQGEGQMVAPETFSYWKPRGRGLMLINTLADSMWVGIDQRSLFMTFNH